MPLPARLLAGVKARLFGRGDPAATPPQARGSVTYLSALDPGSAQRLKNYTSYLGAVTIPDVYKCISVISNTYAATALRILDQDDDELDLKKRLPQLDALMRRPNPEMRGRQFRQTLSHHYQLCGNAIVLKDNYDGLGRPTELWPLRPDRVHILRSDVGQLAYGYDVTEGGRTRTEWYDGADVLHVRWAHPSDPLFGLGVIEAGEQAFSRSRLVNEFSVNFFSRGGIVDGVLTTPGEIPEEDRRALVADWRAMREGARNTMRTALLWAGASYQQIQEPLGRVPVMDLTRMSLVDIAQLFGVPLQLLGDFSESNYRNAQEAVQFFYGETLGPQLAQFEEDFWTPLLEDFDPGLRAAYEQREVVDYQMRADAAAKLAATGAFDVDDIRVAAGFDPRVDSGELGAMVPLPKGMTLLSPEQALALGEAVQEAPEEPPPAPEVTEVGQPAPEAVPATPQPAAKSTPGRVRGQKTYPAALLSPQRRQQQHARQLASPATRQAPGRLRLLSGAKEKEAPATETPVRRTVSARPAQSDLDALRRAYLDWAEQDEGEGAAWAEVVAAAAAAGGGTADA